MTLVSQDDVLAGGTSSPVRSGMAVGGTPFIQVSGRGAYAYDAEGRSYVDYLMAYGPLLFGHAHPALVSGLDAIAAGGTVFGSTCAAELQLAHRIAGHMPSLERLRFTSTGTEAMMSAVRVARAFTGRSLIARFAGGYHGHFDAVLESAGASAGPNGCAGSDGISPGARREAVVVRYNDLADFDAKVGARAGDLAGIIVEPVAANMGLIPPVPGFLGGLFERARMCGALVIFDEVVTWLRLGLGGAQAAGPGRPDLTALGKIAGGGFPLAAFGGRADVMAALSPGGASFSGGTFSGNPFSIALGHRTLDLLERDPSFYAKLDARANELAGGMRAIFERRGLPYAVTQIASMVDFAFRYGAPARNFEERSQADRTAFSAYYHAMRERGILLAPSPNELMFVSSAHGPTEITLTLDAFDASLETLQQRGLTEFG